MDLKPESRVSYGIMKIESPKIFKLSSEKSMEGMQKALTPNPSNYGASSSRTLDPVFGRKEKEPQRSTAEQ